MNSYIVEIKNIVLKQLKDVEKSKENEDKKIIIRIDNFSDLKIYYELCVNLRDYCKNNKIDFIAKLSREKYYSENSHPYIERLVQEDWIEKKDTLTKWRNHDVSCKTLILLMASEVVEDKGGLHDFYSITPESVDEEIKNKYSKFFQHDNYKLYIIGKEGIIDNIFKTIFSKLPKNLIRLSNLADDLENEQFLNFDEILKKIFIKFYEYWNLPNVDLTMDDLKKIKASKGKLPLLDKIFKFKERKEFENLNDSKLKKYEDKIEKWKDENKVDGILKWEDNIFLDFAEFQNILLEYIKGEKLEKNTHRLFSMDFNKILNILDIKEEKTTLKSNKTFIVKGNPLPILLQSIGILLYDKNREYNDIEKIEVRVEKVILKGAPDERETSAEDDTSDLFEPWKNISRYLGGLLDYINHHSIFKTQEEKNIRVSYCDEDEFFSIDNFKMLRTNKILTRLGDDKKYSSIKFRLTPYNSENDSKEWLDVEYKFLYNELWSLEFLYFTDLLEEIGQKTSFLPFLTSRNLKNFLAIHDEEEFANALINMDLESNGNLIEKIQDYWKNYENDFIKLGMMFKDTVKGIENNGYFKMQISTGKNNINSFINEYICIAQKLKQIDVFQSKPLLNIFTNLFMILEDEGKINEVGESKVALSLSTHPAMLEKALCRNLYIIRGFEEVIEDVLSQEINSGKIEKIIEQGLNRLEQFSTISSAIDILPKNSKGTYSESIYSYGLYSFYRNSNNLNNETSIISFSNIIKQEVSLNDEIDVTEFTKESNYSKIIGKTIIEYIKIFPSAIDDLSLIFVNPQSLQHIVAAIEMLKKDKELKEILDAGILLRINIMTDKYNIGGDSYLSTWINHSFNDDNLKIEVCYNSFSREADLKDELEKIKENNPIDIIIIGNILKESNITFMRGENIYDSIHDIKFPIVYKPCLFQGINRKVQISQPQFSAATYHGQICYKISNDESNGNLDEMFIYREMEFSKEKKQLLEVAHQKGKWIMCIDKSIDKELIVLDSNDKKVISFTSGEGLFGEYNVTLSTINKYMGELEKRLEIKLGEFFFGSAKGKSLIKALEYTNEVDGITLLKAINLKDRQINKYLTYVALNEYLDIKNINNKILINLDAYKHWFLKDEKFPDYLELELLKNESGKILINANIIECKLGKTNYAELEDAKNQIYSGYERLVKVFNAENGNIETRYWNAQLYRVILYSLHDKKTLEDLSMNLSVILEGKYEVKWKGKIITFWTNLENSVKLSKEIEYKNLKISTIEIGRKELQKLMTGEEIAELEQIEIIPEIRKIPSKNEEKRGVAELEYNSIEEDEKGKRNIDITIINKNQEILELDSIIEKIVVPEKEEKIQEEISYAKEQLRKLIYKLSDIGNNVSPFENGYDIGPNFIRLKLFPEGKTSVSRIEGAGKDIQVALALNDVPYVSAAKGYIGVDIPRLNPSTVFLGNILEKVRNKKNLNCEGLEFIIGVDEVYNPITIDMQDSNYPHMLIAGQSGSGKSVLINCIILNTMINHTPEQVKMILIDPKKVELYPFKDSPFLEREILTEPEEAIDALEKLAQEMDNRYEVIQQKGAKDLKKYNTRVNEKEKLHRIFVVFDEYGEFMEKDKDLAKKIESLIIRLSQKGRAAGIHLIVATQSPKANIITTTIRNNLPARVALRVPDKTASNVILDESGAEILYGKGDLLFKSSEFTTPRRLKSPFIDEDKQEELISLLNNYYKK